MTHHPGIAVRPAYTWSKLAGTVLFELLAQSTAPEKAQIINFHPGLIYNDLWEAMGVSKEWFDSGAFIA